MPAQRLAWERFVLGLPVSVQLLAAVADRLSGTMSLAHLPELAGQPVTVAGYRLPGWNGGSGFYLSDGQIFVLARASESLKAPSPWQPILVQGRWLNDTFGTTWLQVAQMSKLDD